VNRISSEHTPRFISSTSGLIPSRRSLLHHPWLPIARLLQMYEPSIFVPVHTNLFIRASPLILNGQDTLSPTANSATASSVGTASNLFSSGTNNSFGSSSRTSSSGARNLFSDGLIASDRDDRVASTTSRVLSELIGAPVGSSAKPIKATAPSSSCSHGGSTEAKSAASRLSSPNHSAAATPITSPIGSLHAPADMKAPALVAPVQCKPNSLLDDLHSDVLARVLFIFAKLNPGIRYVQGIASGTAVLCVCVPSRLILLLTCALGMNEILAPMYYIYANDPDSEWSSKRAWLVAVRLWGMR